MFGRAWTASARPLSPTWPWLRPLSPAGGSPRTGCFQRGRRFRAVVLGLFMAVAAMASMTLAIRLQPGVIFDLRSAPLAVAGLFGGPIGAAIAGGCAMLYRILLGGVGTAPGRDGHHPRDAGGPARLRALLRRPASPSVSHPVDRERRVRRNHSVGRAGAGRGGGHGAAAAGRRGVHLRRDVPEPGTPSTAASAWLPSATCSAWRCGRRRTSTTSRISTAALPK